jgi:hypothetical protein
MKYARLRRIIRMLRDHRVALIGTCVFIIFFLGYLGLDALYASTPNVPRTFLDRIYGIFQILRIAPGITINNPGWELEITRWLAIFLIGYSAFTLVARFSSREIGLLGVRLGRGHVVIGGLNPLGTFLAQKFALEGSKVVMIGRPAQPALQPLEGVLVLQGNSPYSLLQEVHLGRAGLLLCVEEDDALNADLLGYAYAIMERKATLHLEVMVHLVDPVLCNLVRAKLFRLGQNEAVKTEFFNIYYHAGRELLHRYPPFPLEGTTPPPVHVLVVGMGRMGESLVVHIAKEWRRRYGGSGKKVILTLTDLEAKKRSESLIFRYPSLAKYAEIHPLDTDVQPSVLSDLSLQVKEKGGIPITIGYVCLADTVLGLSAALILHEKLKGQNVPIIVRTQSDRGFTSLLSRMDMEGESSPLIPFPQYPSDIETGDFIVTTRERIARAIHEEYLELIQKEGSPSPPAARTPWKNLPPHLKEANREQADDIIRKIGAIECDLEVLTNWDEPLFQFTREEIEHLALQEHKRWMEERASKGWQYAPQRDDRRKLHPSMIPWEQLSEVEKEKDRNAVRSLPSILYRVDLRIVRRGSVLQKEG